MDTRPAGRRSPLERQLGEDYREFERTRTIRFPSWLYGAPRGRVFALKVEDHPRFGEDARLEVDSGRAAFLSVDMQRDFCGPGGYVDAMGYDLGLTSAPIPPIASVMRALRGSGVKVIHTREGHSPDLSDAPYNKLLRSKLAGGGFGIGDVPPKGVGRLLVRGEANWQIVDELRPEPGEPVVDKPTKGAFASSALDQVLRGLDVAYLLIGGVTTDVCVHSVMREANDRGYWCVLLKDCTAATDRGNYEAAIKQVKMSGGIFGWVSSSGELIKALTTAERKRRG